MSRLRSKIWPRWANGTAVAWNSRSYQPAATPSMRRPPLPSWMVAAVLARMAGSRIGSTKMPVPSMIRLVRAATMLSVVSASRNGNGRRAPRNR